ncbi:MAG TPA: hypothetical protein PLP89_01675 [Synergistales bacterium]|nr:hypothetical protein [Synergistales bacterium]NLV65045.1 hypothetical protein [Synergistaceae bacterium]HRV71150.1 hypothetical protein [Thermovirgaceae bacterium]MDD3133986.1 hypothetical protein [Synergistales bacterium]MDD3830597.1 hypothetical protein [Synergistales bacterium]
MKKFLTAMLIVLMISGVAFAGGDQNCEQHHSDKGQGSVGASNPGNGDQTQKGK